jgi:hypothetical protein
VYKKVEQKHLFFLNRQKQKTVLFSPELFDENSKLRGANQILHICLLVEIGDNSVEQWMEA